MRATLLAFGLLPPLLMAAVEPRLSRGDLADWLAGRDLVVEGRVVDGHAVKDRFWRNSYTVAVSRVLLGVAEDTTLTVMSGQQEFLPPGALVPTGQRVIAYASRITGIDGRRLTAGGVLFLLYRDTLVGTWGLGDIGWLRGIGPGQEISVRNLLSRLETTRRRSSIGAIQNADGLALVRLGEFPVAFNDTAFSYRCDSLRWVIPTAARIPRRIVFHRPCECFPNLGPGREMMLPVPIGTLPDSIVVDACPDGWVIEDGFVRGLGVPLTEIYRALEVRDGRIHVREFLKPKAAEPPAR